MSTKEDYNPQEEVELDLEGYGYGEYYDEDEEVDFFDESEEAYYDSTVEEVKKSIKPSRIKFIKNIQNRVAEEIVEVTEQYVSEDDSIYREKVARDELFLSRMLKVSGVLFLIVVILALISLVLN